MMSPTVAHFPNCQLLSSERLLKLTDMTECLSPEAMLRSSVSFFIQCSIHNLGHFQLHASPLISALFIITSTKVVVEL
jgi:hypothetical protein